MERDNDPMETPDVSPPAQRPSTLTSKLEHGRQRFLAHAIEHALEIGRRTPEDFIRHFPPKAIMEALALRPDLRAGLLVPTTGLKPRIALKKTWQSAGDDLQSALDEGETKPAQIVAAFAPDDRVLYLQDKKLWAFIVEGQFWKVTAKEDKAAFATAQQHVAYLLERALLDGLITPRDVVDGIGVNELCNRLPRTEMAALFTAALEGGRKAMPFTDRDLLAPLPHIFDAILHTRVAKVHGYLPDDAKPAPPAAPEPAAAAPAAEVKPVDGVPADAAPPGVPVGAPPATENGEETPPAKTNGSGTPSTRRRSTKPPAEGETAAPHEEGDTEWIEIPESTR